MYWGFSCADGWFKLIYDLSKKLEPLIQKELDKSVNKLEYPRASQVKEKFGELRFYMSSGSKEIYDLIAEAEKISCTICEDCGNSGELCVDHGWYRTLCPECVDKYNKGFDNGWGFRARNYIQCSKIKKGENDGNEEESSKENEG